MSEESPLSMLSEVLARAASGLPGPAREKFLAEAFALKELLMEARPPRLLVVGRRGAGKSSLINAIFGEEVAAVGSVLAETARASWYSYSGVRGELRILDTRGLGDLSRAEGADPRGTLSDIDAALRAEAPDAILFLCKAKEVDARVSEDIANLRALRESIAGSHGIEPPVIAVVTQIDELDPKRVEPPYEDSSKQHNIRLAEQAVTDALRSQGLTLARVVSVSAYAEYKDGALVYSNAWNIAELVGYVIDELPRSAQLQLARLSRVRAVQEKLARRATAAAAAACGGIAAVPIPVADIVPLTAVQVGLITGIAYLSGRDLSPRAAGELLMALGANVGTAFVLREAARALAKLVFPIGGEVISAGVAIAGTWAVGEAATTYFIRGGSIAEARKVLRRRRRPRVAEL